MIVALEEPTGHIGNVHSMTIILLSSSSELFKDYFFLFYLP